MRVAIPHDNMDPFSSLGTYFASEMVEASQHFSKTVYKQTKLPLRVFEAARARTADINGCMVCRAFRAKRDLPDFYEAQNLDASTTVIANGAAPDEAFYENVLNWETYPGYSDRERIAIEYAERFCLDPQSLAADDRFWEGAKQAFSDDEIVDLSLCVASFITTGRMAHVLGLDTICSIIEIGRSD